MVFFDLFIDKIISKISKSNELEQLVVGCPLAETFDITACFED